VIKTRLDRKATNISVLAAIGVRRDGQKVLLSIRNMGGESTVSARFLPRRLVLDACDDVRIFDEVLQEFVPGLG